MSVTVARDLAANDNFVLSFRAIAALLVALALPPLLCASPLPPAAAQEDAQVQRSIRRLPDGRRGAAGWRLVLHGRRILTMRVGALLLWGTRLFLLLYSHRI